MTADGPGHFEAVRVVHTVDGVVEGTVVVDDVTPYRGTKPHQIEPGVATHQWIERPRDGFDALCLRPRSLVLLEGEPNPGLGEPGVTPVECDTNSVPRCASRPSETPTGSPSSRAMDRYPPCVAITQ